MVRVNFDSDEELHKAIIILLDGRGSGYQTDKNGIRQIIISEIRCELLQSKDIKFNIVN